MGLRISALVVGLVLSAAVASRGEVDDGEPSYVVVKAARVVTVTGEEFSPGIIVIEDGKITAVGASLEYPAAATVIDAGSETVTPGLILTKSRRGLASYTRSGVHGDQTAASEVYFSEIDFEPLLKAGYTTVAFAPDGGGIPGVAVAYRTGGAEDARRLGDSAYLRVNPKWSSKGTAMLRDALKKAADEIEKVEKARKEWDEKQEKKADEKKDKGNGKPDDEDDEEDEEDDEEGEGNGDKSPTGQASSASSDRAADDDEEKKETNGSGKPDDKKKKEPETFKPPKIDPKYQPLVDLIQEKDGARMLVELGKAADLLHLDDAIESYENLEYSLFFGQNKWYWSRGTSYTRVAVATYEPVVESLGERKARVVLPPYVHFLPYTTFRYNMAAELANAGCEVTLTPRSDSRRDYLEVRTHIADLIRAGLSWDDAVKSLTLHPARVLGLDERLGSIESGREADLTFFDGDPFDGHSSVSRVMILGEVVWEAASK